MYPFQLSYLVKDFKFIFPYEARPLVGLVVSAFAYGEDGFGSVDIIRNYLRMGTI